MIWEAGCIAAQTYVYLQYIKSGTFTKIFYTSAYRCVIIDQHVTKWQIIRIMAKKPTKRLYKERQRIQNYLSDVSNAVYYHLDRVRAGSLQMSAVWRDLASYKQEMNMELF